MARRIGQMVGCGRPTSWLVRVCSGRDPEAKKREYLNQTIRGRTAGRSNSSQRMLGEREIAAGVSTPRDEPYYELALEKTGFGPTPWATKGVHFRRRGHAVRIRFSRTRQRP